MAKTTGTALTVWQEKLAAMGRTATAAVATAAGGVPRISFRAGIMTFKEAPIKGNAIECVILGFAFENQWYSDPEFDPNAMARPDCFALNMSDAKPMAPVQADCTLPQHTDCETCPKFQWDSDRKGGRGKDCKQKVRLVLMARNDLDAEDLGDIAKADLVLATVPTTSVKNFSKYVNSLATEFNSHPLGVLTKISCRPDQDVMVVVEFEAVAALDDEALLEVLFNRLDEVTTAAMKPYDKNDPNAEPKERPPARRPLKAQRGRR